MRRVLALFLPMWSIDLVRRRWRREGETPAPRHGDFKSPCRGFRGFRGLPAPPVLLIHTLADRQLIACCCEHSLAAGVRPGMTLAHARALLPETKGQGPRAKGRGKGTEGSREQGIKKNDNSPRSTLHSQLSPHITAFDPHRDLAALLALAEWATRFCPVVAPDSHPQSAIANHQSAIINPQSPLSLPGLILDITGCERLYRGEKHLLRRVTAAVEKLGFRCRAAIAPTLGAAWAVSRFGPRDLAIIDDLDLVASLRPLPLPALRIEDDITAALMEVGVECVGHLIDLPRSSLPSRFGDDLLLRLDQALGRAIETINPVRPVPPASAEITFAGPATQLQAVTQASRQLLDQLVTQLQQRESGARQLLLTLTRAEAQPWPITVICTRPSRDAKHLWSLLAPQIEKANLGHGVDRLTLTAVRSGRLRHEQGRMGKQRRDQGIEGPRDRGIEIQPLGPLVPRSLDPSSPALGPLLDVLLARLGSPRVLAMEPVETHQPQRAFRFRPADAMSNSPPFQGGVRGGSSKRSHRISSRPSPQEPCITFADQPSMLFNPPEPTEVIAVTPDGPPSWFRWRGQAHHVAVAIGPLRVGHEWWRGERSEDKETKGTEQSFPWSVDYFRVADDTGRWLWFCRAWPSRRWFVCGQWG